MLSLLFINSFAQKHGDTLAYERLQYVQDLKNAIAGKVWKDFENDRVTQVYFTDSSSYFFNADTGILQKVTQKTSPLKRIDMFKTKRIDENPFHMETAVELTDSTALYFQKPIVMFSDFETARGKVSDLQSLQQWASMVVHELFHGYQLQHIPTLKYSNQVIHLRGSQLQKLFVEQKWFAESIQIENMLLISLLKVKSGKELRKGLKQYISLRDARQKRAESILDDFSINENFYEKIEGSAKYVELALLENYQYFPENKYLLRNDPAYKENAYQNFKLDEEPWQYQTESINYFYSTGYNLIRILDKVKADYQ
ncbi:MULTISPECIES: hypothetical protein [Chryseobacterium]|uniref:Aminopeptidase n=1 Tax=Chryseobacterium camelliae TaxID=1265445 RepID=A0ABU0THW4_9FLAO|nr:MULTISPECIES: hypothetical protein [Chryseobacterium]MDT3409483.1 hypothetical protein [Pseudacidovorax intermedius]MDQ1096652.1 hypothetical protein [Chryseobacterium camelliae]MDQ1100594.1 hypothetical protein [Chryseobacterium sp. SORGH_AS_1048]MDR6087934.1 hypothetical protein [Chryseobacterium sp. SORGH_AS_0909]MDR6132308.1 hypothetical protein [Chryseobacterium sp. SORGH_AS_1175]